MVDMGPKQCRRHRAGRNNKRLADKTPEHKGQDQGEEDGFEGLFRLDEAVVARA